MSTKFVFEQSKIANVATVYAQTGDRKIYIHSSYDPIREGKRWAQEIYQKEKDTYVIFGMGLLYHVDALLDIVKDTVDIVLIEPERATVDFMISEGLMKKVGESDNVSLLINFKIEDIGAEINKIFLERNLSNLCVATLPTYETIYPDYYNTVITSLRTIVDKKEFYINTKERFAIEHAQNITANIYEISKSISVDCFMNRFKGFPAVLVSAGPSLEKNIDLLKGREKEVLIITGGRTLKPLLDRGIKPHFVVTVDPSYANFKIFEEVLDCDVPMLTMWVCNKFIINNYKGKKIFSNGTEIEDLDIDIFGNKITELYANGTVSTLQLEFARWIGCENIALIGQDLTDTDGKTHADIAAHNQNNREIYRKSIKVKGNIQDYVYTHEVFKNYIDTFEWYMRQAADEIKVVNCTEGGAFIEGTTVDVLSNFLDTFCTKSENIKEKIDKIFDATQIPTYKSINEIYPYLKDMQRALIKTCNLSEEALKIIKRSLDVDRIADKDLKRLGKIDREISTNAKYHKIANTLSVRTFDNLGKVKIDEDREDTIRDMLRFDRAVYSTMKGTCKAYSMILADVLKEYKEIMNPK